MMQSGQIQKVTQFQVDEWSAEGLCSNPQALVHVIDQMGVAQRRTGNKPIVVHGRLVLPWYEPHSQIPFQYSIDAELYVKML